MIISASRRTDIPAFYSDWFLNRIQAGFLLTRNPFNAKQIKRISLRPDDVDVIVFWTRNPAKLLKHLPLLDTTGYRYYFQFTLTGYGKPLETATLHPLKAIEIFQKLSEQIGADKVIWRYDPILVSNLTPVQEHLRLFEKIARHLHQHTRQVVISFADLYRKTEVNLRKVAGLRYHDILHDADELRTLCQGLSEIARHYQLSITTCAETTDLTEFGIRHGKCVDDVLLRQIFGLDVSSTKDPGQRQACGCIQSVDIGSYNTCLHGCQYCYATSQQKTALRNYQQHDPQSPFLTGSAEGAESLSEPEIPVRTSLF
ncbi:DUF1848 domain-containing protein [Vibrio quintilis]|uniref:DUF1848 domain-containing protein n=1 Tax=Vibrio quintilis TaxID=1117707 RepID=A0A1M7YW24_9VIBR|nr:DUF1848 domain-containing protein [Vibrio quintilis]SHO56879.1 hypothetical protein VQ7734_02648 [Vibrio quintilis]